MPLFRKFPPIVTRREETSTAPEVERTVKAVVEAFALKVLVPPLRNASCAKEEEAAMLPESVCGEAPVKYTVELA